MSVPENCVIYMVHSIAFPDGPDDIHDASRQDTGQRRQAMVRTQDSGASDVNSGPVTL